MKFMRPHKMHMCDAICSVKGGIYKTTKLFTLQYNVNKQFIYTTIIIIAVTATK